MTIPATIPQLSTPVVPYDVQGESVLTPLASPSWWSAFPTGISGKLLSAKTQDPMGMLASLLTQASRDVNNQIYGASGGAGDTSVQAALHTRLSRVSIINGEFRLRAHGYPITSVTSMGWEVGGTIYPLPQNAQLGITIEGMTVHVPAPSILSSGFESQLPMQQLNSGTYNIVWQYVSGWFHTQLTESVAAGATTLTVAKNAPNGLVGLWKGQQLTLQDWANNAVETVEVASVSGDTITLTQPTLYAHPLPIAPDFIILTAVPSVLSEAAIYIVAGILLAGGQQAVILSPSGGSAKGTEAGAAEAMYDEATIRLAPYRVAMY